MLSNKSTESVKKLLQIYQNNGSIEDIVNCAEDSEDVLPRVAAAAIVEWHLVRVNKPGLLTSYLEKSQITSTDVSKLFIGTSPYKPLDTTYSGYGGGTAISSDLQKLHLSELSISMIQSIMAQSGKFGVENTVRKLDNYVQIVLPTPTTLFTKNISLARRLFDMQMVQPAAWFAYIGLLGLGKDLQTQLKTEELKELLRKVYTGKVTKVNTRAQVTFNDIGGYEEVKQQIIVDIINVITAKVKRPELLQYGAKLPRGVILHGPPGTGKTMFLEAIANELSATIGNNSVFVESYRLEHASLLGESEALAKATFERFGKLARDNPTGLVVILLDEAEGTFEKRSEDSHHTTKRVIGQLLSYMDGIDKLPDNILFLAATNILGDVDPAFLRTGRFDYTLKIEYPDQKTVHKIYETRLRDKSPNLQNEDLSDVVAHSLKTIPYCTASDVAGVVGRAAKTKMSELMLQKGWQVASADAAKIDKMSLMTAIDWVGAEKKKKAQATSATYGHEILKDNAVGGMFG
jgi:ATP-dependent 26S proteasome regulatory subunit